jgi:uncharacterized protein YndB with AHSA1/START domain
MPQDFPALASIEIHAPVAQVREALTDPRIIAEYMFGARVASTWKKGEPITWTGEWKGKPYQDKGVILRIEPPRLVQYTHFSPLAGLPDVPENYHTVTIRLTPKGHHTGLSLAQDNNPSEADRDHSQQSWEAMLAALKALLEE